ncbi:hypothetical protein GGR66_003620 [Xanthomonas sp. 3498]|nr:hypothetical protein [Xanthomonas sp. 3498]
MAFAAHPQGGSWRQAGHRAPCRKTRRGTACIDINAIQSVVHCHAWRVASTCTRMYRKRREKRCLQSRKRRRPSKFCGVFLLNDQASPKPDDVPMRADMSRKRSAFVSLGSSSVSICAESPFVCCAESSHRPACVRAARAVPSPQPLSRRERGPGFSLLPSGEGAPQGRMRVRAKPRSDGSCVRFARRTLTPTPLPVGEGLGLSLLPSGEGAPQGRMRVGRSLAAMGRFALRIFTPTPLPVGEGR